MCLPYKGMAPEYEAELEKASRTVTWIFIAEMGLKLLALGCADYWVDRWNALDGSIVSISMLEMVLDALFAGQGTQLSFLRTLRLLRVARVLRLMRSWRGLYEVIAVFLRAIPSMLNIIVLIWIFIFIVSIVGMNVLGGIYVPETGYSLEPCPGGLCAEGLMEKPFYNYDYFVPATLTTFVLITGEWVQAMMPAAGVIGPVANAFFVPVVIFGKYLLLNLLVAVLLTEFSRGEPQPNSSIDESGVARRAALESRPSELQPEPSEGTEEWPRDYACGLFGPHSGARKMCRWIVSSTFFGQLIVAAIIVSCVALTLDTPRLDPASQLFSYLRDLDYVLVGIFFLEMCFKVVAQGFALGDGAYIKSAWNQVDFIIVIASLLDLLASSIEQLDSLRILRTLRILRPLRLVSRSTGMKLIITSLFKAMPGVSNVLGVVLCLQIIFAILGMQLFSGTMASCDDPRILSEAECVGYIEIGPNGTPVPLQWANPSIGSFDDFGEAMRLLYVMSSADDWAVSMFRMMGATEPGYAPIRNDFSPAALYSIAWMCVGYIFAINLFVGVVVDNFTRMQQEVDGSASMTKEQQQWVATVKAMMTQLPAKAVKLPDGQWQRKIHALVVSRHFDAFIMLVIVANIFAMACDSWKIEEYPLAWAMYDYSMMGFAFIYYVECILKLIGMGPAGYFRDSWNRFDFFLVCVSLLDEFAAELLPLPPMMLRTLRIFRILRILRLLKNAKGLRDLLITMVLSFPSLLNVSSLLALIIYMYAVLGVQLFTFLAAGGVRDDGESGINDVRNFKDIWSSALLLFQCLTGDGWSDVMVDAMADEASGQCSNAAGDCGSVSAIPYFVTFQLLGSFIFLNLVVAVILENFGALHNINPTLVSASDLELFTDAWSQFDPDATNYIPLSDLPKLLLAVPRPLGLKGRTLRHATRLCMRLDVPQHEGGLVAYNELLVQLVENNYFRSGADYCDEGSFKQVAVPNITGRRLSEVSLLQLRREHNPLLAQSSSVAMGFARKIIYEGMTGWKRKAKARLWLHGSAFGGPGPERSSSALNRPGTSPPVAGAAPGVDAVADAFGHLLGFPQMPASMDVADGVTRLGWLRCNGQKRWVKAGDAFFEVWASHTADIPEKKYLWSGWGVQHIVLDLDRSEPLFRLTLATTDRRTEATLLVQAYEKESEPTQAERQAHLVGFIDVLKEHLLAGAKVKEGKLGDSLQAMIEDDGGVPATTHPDTKTPVRRLFTRLAGPASREKGTKGKLPSRSPQRQHV